MPFPAKTSANVRVCRKKKSTIRTHLLPLWKVSYYCGIVPDWCQMFRHSKFSTVMNGLGCFVAFVFMVILAAYEVFQLSTQTKDLATVHSVVPNVVCFCVYAFSIISQMRFIMYRKHFVIFFHKFDQMEQQPIILKHFISCGISSKIMYYLYGAMGFGTMIVMGILVNNMSNASYFLTYYQFVREAFTVPVLVVIHVLVTFYTCAVISVADMVPSLTFHHAANLVKILEEEIEDNFRLLAKNRQLKTITADTNMEPAFNAAWMQLEELRELIGQANQLFGLTMLIGHGLKLVMICSLIHSTLYYLNSLDTLNIVMHLVNALFFTLRLGSCVLMASELHHSSRQLKARLSLLTSRHWSLMTKDEKYIIQAFTSRLKSTALAASPWELYTIDRGLLLRILSLTVTYIVILLQSK